MNEGEEKNFFKINILYINSKRFCSTCVNDLLKKTPVCTFFGHSLEPPINYLFTFPSLGRQQILATLFILNKESSKNNANNE